VLDSNDDDEENDEVLAELKKCQVSWVLQSCYTSLSAKSNELNRIYLKKNYDGMTTKYN